MTKTFDKKYNHAIAIVKALQPNAYTIDNEGVKKIPLDLARNLSLAAIERFRMYIENYRPEAVKPTENLTREEINAIITSTPEIEEMPVEEQLRRMAKLGEFLYETWTEGRIEMFKIALRLNNRVLRKAKSEIKNQLWNNL